MSTTERLLDGGFLKRFAIVNGLVPAALLAWDAWWGQLGVNSVNFVIRTTGLIGLTLITLSLVVTPLRALTGWNRVIAVRRELGVIGFAYLVAHFGVFVAFDRQGSLSSTFDEIVTRKYLWFGTAALVMMVPLALTSTDAMVTRLGAVRWKRLHRLAYLIAIGAAIHYYLLVKSDVRQPLAYTAVIGALLLYRVVAHYVELRRDARAGRARAVSVAAPARKTFWSGDLVIAKIFEETHDVKTFRLVPVDGGPLPFMHAAGQYLNLALTIDGVRVNRSYTIASSPTEAAYCELSVKRVPNGYGSKHLHETWREGDRVKVSAPAGKFTFTGTDADRILMIAGGIGVTPMMAVLRGLTDHGWRGQICLLFSVRAVRDIAFRQELDFLRARFPNLHVRVLVSQDPDTPWDGPRGQITREVIADFVPDLAHGPVMLCGPAPMMNAMRALLVGMGVPDAEVRQEEFVSRPVVEPASSGVATAEDDGARTDGEPATISFTRSGRSAAPAAEQTVLEAAEDAGVDIPFECRSGICGQCKTRLVAGRVTMEVEDALTTADRARHLILACQARPLVDIEVDA